MAKLLTHGQKVKYQYLGKERTGIIHGIKTHEEPDGEITRVAYLIDTGKVASENIIATEKGDDIVEQQPEQVEVDQNLVEAV